MSSSFRTSAMTAKKTKADSRRREESILRPSKARWKDLSMYGRNFSFPTADAMVPRVSVTQPRRSWCSPPTTSFMLKKVCIDDSR